MALNMDGEYRDGYYVSAEMKKIWKVELDLLREFLDFCQRNGLSVGRMAAHSWEQCVIRALFHGTTT